MTDASAFTRRLRDLRQTRRFTDVPVPGDVLDDLLEVARWTGSAKNTQPWHFVVVTDPETRQVLAGAGPFAGFLAGAPLSIVIAMAGQSPRSEPYDEGRVSERIMLAADAHGLGSGTGWFDGEGEARVRVRLGLPEGTVIRSAVGIGYPDRGVEQPRPASLGRKTRAEVVSRERYGQG